MRRVVCSIGILALLVATTAVAEDGEDGAVRWRQIVGIIQVGNVVGSGTGAVTGGFQPWTTTLGVARVNLATGRIQFVVKGLVFAGGNTIGTPAPITGVKGTLVCDTDGSESGGNSVLVETPMVLLNSEGDAHFSGNVGSLPSVCVDQPDLAFLVTVAGVNGTPITRGPWIANGAVRVREHETN
jgi:hypothetical protein